MTKPNQADLTTTNHHGDPMTQPNQADPTTTTHHGDPMTQPNQADPTTTPHHGDPMTQPNQAAPTTTTHHGDPMNDDEDTLPGFPPEAFARAHLAGVASTLGHDEVRVVTSIAQRLQGGQLTYGPLDLARDRRRFREKEAREEIEDALVYFACAWLKTQEVA